MEGTLHLPHQLWGAAWGRVGRPHPVLFPPTSRKYPPSPAARAASPRAKVRRGHLESRPGGRGWRRRREHTHLHAAPGDTKSRSATPPRSPRAGGRPHPAPARPEQAGTSVRGAQRGDARAAPPGAPAGPLGAGGAAPGRPLRGRRLDARPAPAPGAQAPPQRCQAPGRGPCSPRSLPSFLGKPGAGCAHPRAETEHRRGAARQPPRRRREPRPRQGSAPASAGGRRRPLAPLAGGARVALPEPVPWGRAWGSPAPLCSGSVDAVLQLEVTTQQSHLP